MRPWSAASTSRLPLIERRGARRVDVGDRLQATLVDSDIPVRVVDISFGGFLIETAAPFPVGSLHRFRLETADRSVALTLTARTVHSRRDSASAQHSWYLSGFRFLPPQAPDAAEDFVDLLDLVMSELAWD